MSDPSFDVVSEISRPELTNAVTQALGEIKNRFDFKGSKSDIQLEDEQLILTSDNEAKLESVIDVLVSKMAKRGLGLKNFDFKSKIESATGGTVRMKVKIRKGMEKEQTKEVTKLIKDSKLKVNVTIMGECVRITGKKKDDLQEVIHLLKNADLPFDVQFTNYK
ncbi:YajQ family cyclic di-GMP-binding protein [Leptospira kirschneri]|uniref:Nucleotide-binding protein LEP1GSC081_3065 n=2 Tax=Leptospira kirschneri TaxID=29507 RepID=A0A0E2AY33_9LEPT|nr:YajQ family cyclic di-GMP-binding protein [Leptospira kirschneri]EKO13832.1 PF04461 family protein [Leptospira kirschneri str. H1]EKO59429.1 PF04461 family protein [Leptospira kirschneri str. H2]EMK24302.1 PF04461 family protein [Leptospira kirschneri serovar Bulgarica str. Nikolaevo]UML80426.1 YajQ family cyclic di-GMP-binding protein [Leptospira kirschneri]